MKNFPQFEEFFMIFKLKQNAEPFVQSVYSNVIIVNWPRRRQNIAKLTITIGFVVGAFFLAPAVPKTQIKKAN